MVAAQTQPDLQKLTCRLRAEPAAEKKSRAGEGFAACALKQ
jgi:hypothetical protein